MRRLMMAAALILGTGGVALAQMPPGGPPDGGPDRHEMGHDGGRDGWMRHHREHEHDGAAFFRFRRGDAEMDIKCPANEGVQACVAAAGTLMDKVSGMAQPKPQ